MAKYSFNMDIDKSKVAVALAADLNASYKDLGAVCDAIRYKSVGDAFEILSAIKAGMPIYYRRHNKGMGSSHVLHGRKGRNPKKCANMVLKVLQNAYSNAINKGLDAENMIVIHACANKTQILRRSPPKGILYHRSGGEGYSMSRSSDLELAKVEIGLFDNSELKAPEEKEANKDRALTQVQESDNKVEEKVSLSKPLASANKKGA
ncbi:MAG: 50S ribosomal protein L22 [Candidatus Micrarchaeaceae archaeon]